jgi:hypothetical protein
LPAFSGAVRVAAGPLDGRGAAVVVVDAAGLSSLDFDDDEQAAPATSASTSRTADDFPRDIGGVPHNAVKPHARPTRVERYDRRLSR